ncbi:uncharacterized protein MEPE_01068 [Melanopsichium pennsylvanicum]|uniref:Uncharacterized protein n=2 Tax=Melanopsichium pennsylvanicum TaxID=63383 RepID=A0AAJ4XHX0_9BASI|nr:putative protein [Melanopsichium pennsylvanicum 4]SNX82362.1 uncharacterized protein MEPE_01068 [Melanopsichium pennsylvanicum]
MATLPQQAPGPGPTAQALSSYLSYSPVATNVIQYTSTLTQVVYDPQGGFAPYVTTNLVQGTTTSTDYSVVQVPLLYTGPFPAPELGTLYTTPGQSLPSATSAVPTTTATASNSGSNTDASQSATSPYTLTNSSPTSASTQESSLTAESAPTTSQISTAQASTAPTDTSTINSTSAATNSPTSSISINTSTNTVSSSTTGSGNSSSEPSATAAGSPISNHFGSKGLSGGQIAGVVLGAFFALLLLLLLLLCCLRRRRKRHQQHKVFAAATGGGSLSIGSARGNYAALGAGAGAAGLAKTGAGAEAGAAGRRGSLGRDDWEEDHLTGGGSGSGFFVVGGRRLGSDRRASMSSRRSRGSVGGGPSYAAANAPPHSKKGAKTAGLASLAAAGTGFFGSAFGRGKSKNRVEIEEEQPLSDDDIGDGSMAERRGLMPLNDSPSGTGYGSGGEMREASPRVLGPATAMLGAAGAGAAATYAAGRRRNDSQATDAGSPQRTQYTLGSRGAGTSRPASSAFSGSGASSSGLGSNGNATASPHSQRVGGLTTMSSSNSTGGFTMSGSGSGTSLPPPPRAPRSSPQSSVQTYKNIGTSSSSPDTGSIDPNMSILGGQNPRFSADTTDSRASATGGMNPALLGISADALGGLGALAAGHRESDGSTYSRRNAAVFGDVRESHVSEVSAEELSHLRATEPERYSRFISTGTNLLGPKYHPSPDLNTENKDLGTATDLTPFQPGTMGTGAGAFPRTRLPTICSVGEFGEKSDSSGPLDQSTGSRTGISQSTLSRQAVSAASGSLGASSAARHVTSPLPVYEPHQMQAGETLPQYTLHDQPATSRQPSDTEQLQSPISEGQGRFVTPPDSPRHTLGGARNVLGDERASLEAQRYADEADGDVEDATRLQHVDEDRDGAELAEAGVASAGILGGVAAGWRRLTMGQYAWIPGNASSRDHQASSPFRHSSGNLDDDEGRISHDYGQRPSEDSSRLSHQRRASRLNTSDAYLAPEVRSEKASVYEPSALGHNTSSSSPIAHLSSKEASGSSGEQAKNAQSDADELQRLQAASAAATASRQHPHPSSSSQNSSARSRGGGYAASHSNSSVSGRRTTSDSTGLDSLSARAQLSSRSTGSASTRSGYHSSSRGGRSGGMSEASLGSSASTGAASYSPSGMLSRGNTTSTRGFPNNSAPTASATYHPSRPSGEASSLMTDAADGANSEVDITSSRATQGGSSFMDARKRPRSSSVDELSRLDSLHEVREMSDAFGNAEAIPEVPPTNPPAGGHYPSESLGAAVSRSVLRQQRNSAAEVGVHDGPTGSLIQSQPLPQRSRIGSLQPGTSAPAFIALAPHLSTPLLNSESGDELSHFEAESTPPASRSGTLSGIPASASWRPSPRVASAAQRAAEAHAAMLRTQETGNFGGPTPPRSHAASPSNLDARANAGAFYNWADIDTTFRQPDRRQPSADLANAEGAGQDPDISNKSFEWPKFLRF